MATVPRTIRHKSPKAPGGKVASIRPRQKSAGGKDLVQALITSIPQAVVAVDGRRRIVFTNSEFDRMCGKSNVGDRLSDYFDPPGLKKLLKQSSITGRSFKKRELVVPASNPSDPEVNFSVTVTPHSDTALKTRFLLLIDDITEGADREDRMIANSRLVSVGEMAAGVAHELNNPLTAVLGFSQLAAYLGVSPATVRRQRAAIPGCLTAGHRVLWDRRVIDRWVSEAGDGTDLFSGSRSVSASGGLGP